MKEKPSVEADLASHFPQFAEATWEQISDVCTTIEATINGTRVSVFCYTNGSQYDVLARTKAGGIFSGEVWPENLVASIERCVGQAI